MGLLKNLFGACMEFFGFAREKQVLNNTPQMQARATGQTDQQIKDGAAKAVAEGDVDTIRKDLAE